MVAEAAVVGAADPTTGQSIEAFVILRQSAGDGGPDVVKKLRDNVAAQIGAIAKPRSIMDMIRSNLKSAPEDDG